LGTSGAFEVPFPLCRISPVRMRRAVNQCPWTILSSVSPASPGIVLLEPPSQVIGVSDVKFLCLKALKYINVIHEYTLFKYIRWAISTITVFYLISKFS
jgi:hypothetical protein